jgi:hypothetical protein
MRQDHELTRFERRKLEKAKDKLNIYDLGMASNLASVFGYNWIEWIVPMGYPYVLLLPLARCELMSGFQTGRWDDVPNQRGQVDETEANHDGDTHGCSWG